MTLLELIGTISSLGGVYLAAQSKRSAWPLQIVGSAIYLPLFFNAHLFAQALLHIFYICLGLYGFYRWRPIHAHSSHFAVGRLSSTQWIYLNMAGIVLTLSIGHLQWHLLPVDIPYLDSFILVFGIIAQWMQATKKIENWGYWIILNLSAAGIYWYKDLFLIMILYLIYTGIALHGWRQWHQQLHGSKSVL